MANGAKEEALRRNALLRNGLITTATGLSSMGSLSEHYLKLLADKILAGSEK